MLHTIAQVAGPLLSRVTWPLLKLLVTIRLCRVRLCFSFWRAAGFYMARLSTSVRPSVCPSRTYCG